MKTEVDSDNGFFKHQHISFRSGLTEKQVKSFKLFNSDEERFKFVKKLHLKNNYILNVVRSGKSLEDARDFKEQGNKCFQKGTYNVALYFYTKSILNFPGENSTEIAITRANRSAALYHLGRYEYALIDIDAACKLEYPKELMYKIKDRKARCELALRQHKEALNTFRETLAALDDSNLKSETRQKWQRDIQIMISMMSKLPQINGKVQKSEPRLKYERNPTYKAASSAVEIRSGEDVGRYAVASQEIKVGDIVVVEKPHCAVLIQEYAPTNCFQCFKRVEVGEPCPGCNIVIFCSIKCQKRALESHHNIECGVLSTLWASGVSITCLMALRVISQKPKTYFTALNLKESSDFPKANTYDGDDYLTFYNLVQHTEKRSTEDLLHRANIAFFLFQCLKEGKYLDNDEDEDIENLIGGLLLRHLQILQFNAHEVSELHIKGNGYTNSTSVFIGGAVYPTLALFNHSCDPSLTRYFKGTTVITRAVKNINVGDNIAENYGPIFTQTVKAERQEILRKQYWFDCNCEACINSWPLLEKMDINVLPFWCNSKIKCDNIIKVPVTTVEFIVRCEKCRQTTNIVKGLKVLQDTENIFRLGTAYLEEEDVNSALKKFFELYNLVHTVLAPPFKDYHLCQQAIRTCFLAMGNKCKVNKPK